MSDIDSRAYGYEPAQSQLRALRSEVDDWKIQDRIHRQNAFDWQLTIGELKGRIEELEATVDNLRDSTAIMRDLIADVREAAGLKYGDGVSLRLHVERMARTLANAQKEYGDH